MKINSILHVKNLVRWYHLTSAVCCKRHPRTIQCLIIFSWVAVSKGPLCLPYRYVPPSPKGVVFAQVWSETNIGF